MADPPPVLPETPTEIPVPDIVSHNRNICSADPPPPPIRNRWKETTESVIVHPQKSQMTQKKQTGRQQKKE
jgi:hypothetical protein